MQNASSIHNEELLTEEEKSTDELNIDTMEHLEVTCQNLKNSAVFSLFINNRYAGDGTYFADTVLTVLPDTVTVYLNKVEETFVEEFVVGDSYEWETSQMRRKPNLARKKLHKKKEWEKNKNKR